MSAVHVSSHPELLCHAFGSVSLPRAACGASFVKTQCHSPFKELRSWHL